MIVDECVVGHYLDTFNFSPHCEQTIMRNLGPPWSFQRLLYHPLSGETSIHDESILIIKGCEANDIDAVSKAIAALVTQIPDKEDEILSFSVYIAVLQGKPSVVKYLLDQKDAPMDTLCPSIVSSNPSIELLQILIDHGWDINQPDLRESGERLLQLVTSDIDLVRWCLDHGARVEDGHDDKFPCPPLLQSAASLGTVETWKLLRARGAQPGGLMLHYAVSSAASASRWGIDRLPVRMEMVKFLVEELKMDVNAVDTEAPRTLYFGPPLAHAVRVRKCREEVVRYLLEKGADPTITDVHRFDALMNAEYNQNDHVVEMLRNRLGQLGRR